MNEKQKLFCKYYSENEDIIFASKKVGYKLDTAKRLLKKEEIKSYIQKIISNKNIAKENEIIECLTKIMRGEEDLSNDEKSTNAISVKEKLKAAELLGKMYSVFSPKQEKLNDEPIYIIGNDLIEE